MDGFIDHLDVLGELNFKDQSVQSDYLIFSTYRFSSLIILVIYQYSKLCAFSMRTLPFLSFYRLSVFIM